MNELVNACDKNYRKFWKAKEIKHQRAVDKAERKARLIMVLLMVNLAMLAIAGVEGIALIWAMR